MRRGPQRRLDAVNAYMNTAPMNESAINDLYSRFLRTGELPEQRRFAWAVLDRTLRARRECLPAPWVENSVEGVPPRERLFREAIHPFEHVRKAARKLLKALASEGYDPGNPEFVPSDYQLPEFGSFSLHLLGWPDHWVREPYEHQMRRVMEQHARLRAPGERSDFWFREAGRALSTFLLHGTVPVDDELQLYVLTTGEMLVLNADYCGHGDEGLIEAFDAVAKATGSRRKDALARLGPALVRFSESVR